ncbi:MAG: hypothetical protein Edafosvirus34_6 [Edafosvirus sp.]|uniref:Fe2OG dioxygenase domain-containing protein n=1 Tax=Edafosvirus sp. TaxID=2487765 RepID=A0A3G4ZV75_9VIRU|nr:MAG: hypothetical protein Edafosvirus34_6 [Edafosvirus sp.]
MINLNFENAVVSYHKDFIDEKIRKKLFVDITKLFETEETRHVMSKKEGDFYRLNRKTMVFIDKTVNKNIIPKIWGNNVTIFEFPDYLNEIKNNLEKELNFKFNICLANYYTTGKKNIGWHADNEEKGSTSCIASISLGAERLFHFRKKDTKDIYKEIMLHDGSLIVMGLGCQENYDHALPVDKNCHDARLNLTFRLFDDTRYREH